MSGFLSTRKANSGKKSNRGKVIPVNSENPIRRMWNKIENGCSSCQRSTAVIWSIVGLMLIVVMICLLIVYLKSLEHVAFSSCDKFSSYSLYKRKRAKLLMFEKGFECEGDVDLSAFVKCERLEIGKGVTMTANRLDISGMVELKEIIVGDGSCGLLSELEVKDSQFVQLRSIRIGSNALNRLAMIATPVFTHLVNVAIGSSSLNGLLSVTILSVDTLRSFTVGSSSLQKLNRFRISDYSNLQSVQIGADSLVSVRELELNGLWNLNQFEIGERGLIGVERVVLKDANMKMLSSFGVSDCLSKKCLKIGVSVLKNVKQFEIGENSYNATDLVTVEGVDGLESLVIGPNSIHGTGIADSALQVTNCRSLKSIVIGRGAVHDVRKLELRELHSLDSFSYDQSSLIDVEEMELMDVSLKQIMVESSTFGKVRELTLQGMSELKSVVIGENSYRMSGVKRNDGLLKITNCGKLESIELRDGSFEDYESIQLNGLVSLHNMIFGSRCFKYASSLSLDGLNGLRSIRFRSSSFSETESLIIGSNSTLNDIVIGSGSLNGIHSLSIGSNSLNSISSFPFSSFPNVVTITIGSYSMNSIQLLSFNNLTHTQSITLGSSSFQSVGVFELANLMSLLTLSIGSNSLIAVTTIRLGTMNVGVLTSLGFTSSSSLTVFSLKNASVLPNVATLEVLSNSFPNMNEFVVSGIEGLERLVIGDGSVVGSSANSEFRVENCSSLRSIKVGMNSIRGIQSFILRGLSVFASLEMNTGSFCNTRSINFNSLPMQVFEIGNNVFGSVRELVLNKMSELKSVVIGENSFKMSGVKRNDGLLKITNCGKLESIELRDGSFEDYESIQLNGLVSLHNMIFGSRCFKYASSLSLDGLNGLRSIRFRSSSFSETESLIIGSNSTLNDIVIGSGSLNGIHSLSIGSNSLNSISSFPFYSIQTINSISIGSSSLNGLESFNINSFQSINQLSIGSSSLNKLSSISFNSVNSLNRLTIGSNSLKGVKWIELNGLNSVSVMVIESSSLRGIETMRMGIVNRVTLSSFGISSCQSSSCMIMNESSILGNMREFMVLNNGLNGMIQFKISGLSKLESVIIGNGSAQGVLSSDSVFSIENCSSLRSLVIGANAVVNYNRFELIGLNELSSFNYNSILLSNVVSIRFSSIPLTSFLIGSNMFGSVRELVLNEMSELKSVVIGENSFRMSGVKRNDGILRITNCGKLESIELRDGSFEDYESIQLNGLPSLATIQIGEYCFSFGRELQIKGRND